MASVFSVRCKPEELARFRRLAAAAGLSLTAWARRMLLAVADRQEGRPGGSSPKGGRGSRGA